MTITIHIDLQEFDMGKFADKINGLVSQVQAERARADGLQQQLTDAQNSGRLVDDADLAALNADPNAAAGGTAAAPPAPGTIDPATGLPVAGAAPPQP